MATEGDKGSVTQSADARTPIAPSALLEDLVAANRILYANKVLDGFGHVSARHPDDPDRFILARNLAPALVRTEDLLSFDLDGRVLGGSKHALYLERFIHAEIYRHRPDVNAVVHSHSPSLIPFGATGTPLRPIYHMTGFLGEGVPVFDIRDVAGDTDMLIRNSELGRALAQCLGGCPAALMRGHGVTVVGGSIQQVTARAVYMELNARLQQQAMLLGEVKYLSAEEARLAARVNDGQVARPWELWKRQVLEN